MYLVKLEPEWEYKNKTDVRLTSKALRIVMMKSAPVPIPWVLRGFDKVSTFKCEALCPKGHVVSPIPLEFIKIT